MNQSTVVVVNNNGMGQAEPVLSHKLIKAYLNMLDLDDHLPESFWDF
jgi:hypothetical protein